MSHSSTKPLESPIESNAVWVFGDQGDTVKITHLKLESKYLVALRTKTMGVWYDTKTKDELRAWLVEQKAQPYSPTPK
jgi:hypothetical protein